MALVNLPLEDFFNPFFAGSLLPEFRELSTSTQRMGSGAGRFIPVDFSETDDAYHLHADLPGLAKEDIHVSVDKDVVKLSVEKEESKQEDKQEDGVTWHRVERSTVYSTRTLRMPQSADTSAIKAAYANGVLNLTIPKKAQETNKASRITIE